MEFSSFPKNLAYDVKTLHSFSKSTVKLLPDNRTDTVTSGIIIRVHLPQNSIIDLRTFTMYYQGICSTTNSTTGKGHYPRLSSSIIDTLTIYVNGTQIENIQNYNLLYNTLYDFRTSDRFGISSIRASSSINSPVPYVQQKGCRLSSW